VQLYRYFVSQPSEFCRHNPLCCFSTSVYCYKRIFRYRLNPETSGYTLAYGTFCKEGLCFMFCQIEYEFFCMSSPSPPLTFFPILLYFLSCYFFLFSTIISIPISVHLFCFFHFLRFPAGAGNFSLRHRVQTSSVIHSASYPMGTGGSYPRGCAKLTNHLHIVLRLRMLGAIPPLPQYVFMAWYLVTHSDNFTFTSFLLFPLQIFISLLVSLRLFSVTFGFSFLLSSLPLCWTTDTCVQ
jgi:hypothetical protein